jgi:hypothetical protein
MTDEELRSLVREAVARHLALGAPAAPPTGLHPGTEPIRPGTVSDSVFHRYALSRGDDLDGACLIEPKVRCNHCGFCQSHGF